jgi:hypothetical protein
VGYLVGAGQPPANFLKAQTPTRVGSHPGIVMKEMDLKIRAARVNRNIMFLAELRKGPYTHDMEEKEYWNALMSYTAELFSDAPDDLADRMDRVRAERRWYELGKYAKAYPNTMEAAAYRMYDDARRARHERSDHISELYEAGLIDPDEYGALLDQASARYRAVVALANAFVPIRRLLLTGNKLVSELDPI